MVREGHLEQVCVCVCVCGGGGGGGGCTCSICPNSIILMIVL